MDKYIKLEKAKKLLVASNTPSLEKVVISDYLNAWAIEVSEDCIDRYSVLAELDPRSYEYKAVKELPNVISKPKESECPYFIDEVWCNLVGKEIKGAEE